MGKADQKKKKLDMEHLKIIDKSGNDLVGQEEDEDEVEVEQRWIGFEVEQCPPSLKLLVRICIFGYFSFSGIVFKTPKSQPEVPKLAENPKVPESQLQPPSIQPPPPRSFKSRLITFVTLAIHLLAITNCITPLFLGPFELKQDHNYWLHIQKLHTNRSHATDKEHLVELDLDKLKPILRHMIKSTFYICMIDYFIQYLLNLLIGGRLISQITRIPGILKHDPNYKLGLYLLFGTFTIIAGYTLPAMLIFNGKELKTIIQISFGFDVGKGVAKEKILKLGKTWLLSVLFQCHYSMILSIVSMLFVYTMVICRRYVEALRMELVGADLTETQMYCIKARLTTLSLHFTAIIRYFALPLTVNMIANALLLIASSCFMLLHTSHGDDYFIVFIFNLGVFAFLRLVIVCAFGNTVTNSYHELIREIYEAVPEWTLESWMDFIEIKRLAEKFEVNIGGVYFVRQSAILTVLGFSLNYIVVLLQTENYGARGAGLNPGTALGVANGSVN